MLLGGPLSAFGAVGGGFGATEDKAGLADGRYAVVGALSALGPVGIREGMFFGEVWYEAARGPMGILFTGDIGRITPGAVGGLLKDIVGETAWRGPVGKNCGGPSDLAEGPFGGSGVRALSRDATSRPSNADLNEDGGPDDEGRRNCCVFPPIFSSLLIFVKNSLGSNGAWSAPR